jgi:hypothetical protein
MRHQTRLLWAKYDDARRANLAAGLGEGRVSLGEVCRDFAALFPLCDRCGNEFDDTAHGPGLCPDRQRSGGG